MTRRVDSTERLKADFDIGMLSDLLGSSAGGHDGTAVQGWLLLLQSSESMNAFSMWLGHARTATTTDTYGRKVDRDFATPDGVRSGALPGGDCDSELGGGRGTSFVLKRSRTSEGRNERSDQTTTATIFVVLAAYRETELAATIETAPAIRPCATRYGDCVTVPGDATTCPTVGVVIPVLDAVDTVDAAIDSVIGELAAASRVVVVDGGSSDGTLGCLAARSDIELIPQVGHGLAAARNQGVAVLDTDLVAFCDADDRWIAGGFEPRLRHLRDHLACAVVGGAVVPRLVDGHRASAARSQQLGRQLPGYTPGALLVRRSVFDTIGGFEEGLTIASDSAWLARLLDADVRFDLIDDVVLSKGVRSDSLSTDVETYRHELLMVVRGCLHDRRQRASG